MDTLEPILRRRSIRVFEDRPVAEEAAEPLLREATGRELGAARIDVYPDRSTVRSVRRLLNIPEHGVPLGMAYVGHPGERKELRTHYDDKRVYWHTCDPDRKHRAKHAPTQGHF